MFGFHFTGRLSGSSKFAIQAKDLIAKRDKLSMSRVRTKKGRSLLEFISLESVWRSELTDFIIL